MKKKYILSFALAVGLSSLISGCGDSTSSTNSTGTANEVTVQRGPVLRAIVMDANAQIAQEVGDGKYQFANTPVYPVMAVGGFIDVNRNGVVDEGDINNTLVYYTNDGKSVTLVSTIAQNSEIRNYLKSTYGLSDTQIDNDLPDNDEIIAAISDEVFAYCVENNISDPKNISLNDVENLETQIKSRLEMYNQDQNRTQMEEQLVNQLGLQTLNQQDVDTIRDSGDNVNNRNMSELINSLPDYNLTLDDKQALAHMWNEEKLAHDLYLSLYSLYPNNVFYTIATRAEAQHESSVQDLIAKYDLNITSSDFNGTYDPDELAQYSQGEFILPEIQDLYNTLYSLGSKSEVDALQVGCMVEVTDIDDLNKYINDSNATPDMKVVFDHLRDGSYHHYWAFDKALKNIGVSNGCCSAGDEYCKTTQEYPDTMSGYGGR